MKKNWLIRIATLAIVLTVATACIVSGTFARYVTTDEGSDSARVAAWGVEITVDDAVFTDEDGEIGEETGEFAFKSLDAENIVAPGMSGSMLFSFDGQPEVALDITFEVKGEGYDATWKESGEVEAEDYFPLRFTVTYQIDGDDDVTVSDDVDYATFVSNLEDFYNFYPAGEDLSIYSLLIEWEWPLDGGNDEADTYLGDLETAPEFDLEIKVTIKQQIESQE